MCFKINFYRLRCIEDYLDATNNEIEVDRSVFLLGGVSPEKSGYFPRPARWVVMGKRFPILLKLMAVAARIIWLFGGAAIYFFVQVIGALARVSVFVAPVSEGCVLAFSTRAGDIVHLDHINEIPRQWITLPWVPLNRSRENNRYIDVFSLVTRRELLQAWVDALRATFAMARRRKTSKWILQSYTAWRWFVVRAAVDKLPGPLLMVEHYDRWAVLTDSSVWSKKFIAMKSGSLQRRELILMQHGCVGSLGGTTAARSSEFRLHRRLRAVTRLHVYGPAEERAFKESILSEACVRRGIEVTYFTPRIELQNLVSEELPRVLFVGHPICENLHLTMLESLQKEYECFVFYKPHPTTPVSERMRNPSWKVIQESDQFPVVDLVISYPSTLVAEYSAHNIPAAVHPIDLNGANSGPILDEIRNRLACCMNKKMQPGTGLNEGQL